MLLLVLREKLTLCKMVLKRQGLFWSNADKNRRATEMELSDVNEALSDASVQNQSIAAAKRKLESEMQTLNADLDEMSSEARLCEDKASQAMVDAARLADELL